MKYIYPLLITLAFTVTSVAQKTDENTIKDRREKMESRMESQKVAFITQELDLTPEEAQQFWPIYNEFQSKMKEFRRQSKLNLKNEDISKTDANDFLDNLFNLEQKELDSKKNYFTKLKSAIPVKKVAKLYILEKKFREKILTKIKNKIGKKRRNKRMGN